MNINLDANEEEVIIRWPNGDRIKYKNSSPKYHKPPLVWPHKRNVKSSSSTNRGFIKTPPINAESEFVLVSPYSINDYLKRDYLKAIVAVKKIECNMEKDSPYAGTGFLVSFENKTYAVTCAHVLKDIKPDYKEGESVELKPVPLDNTLQAIICWMQAPNDVGPKNWNAKQDIAILRLEESLPSKLCPFKINQIPYNNAECMCFGFVERRGIKGDWLGKILCKDQPPLGDGSVELQLLNKHPIESGASGAPLINEKGNIVGMVQAKSGKGNTGFMIPISRIIDIFEDIKDSI